MAKTMWQIIDEKQDECDTAWKWRQACEWLKTYAEEVCESLVNSKRAIDELYGEKGVDIKKLAMAIYESPEQTDAEILNEYGYTKDDAIIVAKEDAVQLYKLGVEVLILGSDNTARPIQDIKELIEFENGYLGVSFEEAERLQKALDESKEEKAKESGDM